MAEEDTKRTSFWKPFNLFTKDNDIEYDLVVLNHADLSNQSLFRKIWSTAQIKVVVDGAANCLYNSFENDRENYLPDLLTGDFDSILPQVKDYYKDKGVDVIDTPDQDFTDFTKALKVLSERSQENQVKPVLVYGSFGGRLDHMFGIIHTLFEASKFMSRRKIVLMSPDTTALLLPAGNNSIAVDPSNSCKWCGLIPVGEPCENVTTQGLKWNLDKQQLKFGDLISTSNTLASNTTDTVTIQTDRPLLWIMGIDIYKVSPRS